jgi:hypothetical protein
MTGLTLPSSVATVIQLGVQPQLHENGKDAGADLNPLLRSFGFLADAPAKPQPMLIESILPLEGLTFIGGQSSAGKTFIAVLMAACLATGRSFFGREIKERVGCVIVAAEGRAMLPNRIRAALKELEEDPEQVPIVWLKETPDFSNRHTLLSLVEKLKALSEHFQKQFGVRLGVVFVDTVSASFDLEEEADNAEAAKVCKIMRSLGEQATTLVIPIHHYGKNAGVGLRGASAWRGSADIILSVTAEIDPTTGNVSNRQLSMAKDRDGAQGPLTGFSLKPVPLGLDDAGKAFGSMVAVAEGGTSKTTNAWPPSLAVLHQALNEALLAGINERPYPDGPMVTTAAVEAVRQIFSRLTYVDSPPDKRGEAIRKQFSRRLNEAQQRHLIGLKADNAGHEKVWIVRRQADPDTFSTSLGGELSVRNDEENFQ